MCAAPLRRDEPATPDIDDRPVSDARSEGEGGTLAFRGSVEQYHRELISASSASCNGPTLSAFLVWQALAFLDQAALSKTIVELATQGRIAGRFEVLDPTRQEVSPQAIEQAVTCVFSPYRHVFEPSLGVYIPEEAARGAASPLSFRPVTFSPLHAAKFASLVTGRLFLPLFEGLANDCAAHLSPEANAVLFSDGPEVTGGVRTAARLLNAAPPPRPRIRSLITDSKVARGLSTDLRRQIDFQREVLRCLDALARWDRPSHPQARRRAVSTLMRLAELALRERSEGLLEVFSHVVLEAVASGYLGDSAAESAVMAAVEFTIGRDEDAADHVARTARGIFARHGYGPSSIPVLRAIAARANVAASYLWAAYTAAHFDPLALLQPFCPALRTDRSLLEILRSRALVPSLRRDGKEKTFFASTLLFGDGSRYARNARLHLAQDRSLWELLGRMLGQLTVRLRDEEGRPGETPMSAQPYEMDNRTLVSAAAKLSRAMTLSRAALPAAVDALRGVATTPDCFFGLVDAISRLPAKEVLRLELIPLYLRTIDADSRQLLDARELHRVFSKAAVSAELTEIFWRTVHHLSNIPLCAALAALEFEGSATAEPEKWRGRMVDRLRSELASIALHRGAARSVGREAAFHIPAPTARKISASWLSTVTSHSHFRAGLVLAGAIDSVRGVTQATLTPFISPALAVIAAARPGLHGDIDDAIWSAVALLNVLDRSAISEHATELRLHINHPVPVVRRAIRMTLDVPV